MCLKDDHQHSQIVINIKIRVNNRHQTNWDVYMNFNDMISIIYYGSMYTNFDCDKNHII